MQSEITVGAALGIILILLLFYRPVAIKQHNSKRLKQFRTLLSEQNISADLYDYFNNRIVALDYSQAKIVFIEFTLSSWKYRQVSINELKKCLVEKIVSEGDDISTIVLDCYLNDQSVLRLTFYNARTDSMYDARSLLRKAEYWQRKINQLQEIDRPRRQGIV
ncbi:hypothetical protein ACFSQD_16975 [Flavihumibacter stibioxidans]|uniref:DUF4760 domain-containing protein n=1 Tax=Flavihumibacter stibioxidans TaxID=1834163 RepID=A0ABR7MCX0_9BACT|nr:hypothetical protein [Flavihumibacter stibioxidans]MBC6492885.1 hypothetical protein [Flavihumibacter stibioxidans]